MSYRWQTLFLYKEEDNRTPFLMLHAWLDKLAATGGIPTGGADANIFASTCDEQLADRNTPGATIDWNGFIQAVIRFSPGLLDVLHGRPGTTERGAFIAALRDEIVNTTGLIPEVADKAAHWYADHENDAVEG